MTRSALRTSRANFAAMQKSSHARHSCTRACRTQSCASHRWHARVRLRERASTHMLSVWPNPNLSSRMALPVAIDVSASNTLLMQRLSPRATLPAYQTPGSAGLDLAACLPEGTPSITIEPGNIVIVPTGWALAIPAGHEGQVRPRSGLATKHGITVPNAPGTIDSDYRGELRVALINLGKTPFVLDHGMRMAQLVIAPVSQVRCEEVPSLDTTRRATGGFGSTGLA